ncbi:MoxR family ATPase [Aetokthonos hydrillicola Thurmond2011]|jgi:MoxR-like ATPase|uniref:MoxR family ATPase n=1 Tax=Aetokthonos hydrillicola Thurmond2011 TaxID=2712845 RepID=A0AAP5M4A2_9CYAN|nr:MoxR family ATPase [Aetokthonos hydrillicola]MBO3457635.1 MoxR family ATPase [Aetokthonos hydrillicola CCALA 1050]MBW4587914.1 MoxR family ATPase [Aetokthonos hydrillicola CCALA 1050]MDR9894681.1 MoxR family ATPase [Aetokthonos hydrillicola Thurmond2011]
MNNLPEWNLEYTGTVNPKPEEGLSPYLPNEELKESVRLAIALERPLLIMGEPGSGKTRLAGAIAYEFTKKNHQLLEERGLQSYPYEAWYIKSTSRARDGLYVYDAVARLRDAQLAAVNQLDTQGLDRLKDPNQKDYIKYGALGKAFQNPLRTIILIDEIDKADIDFPNDLLLELDEKRFFIEETQTWVPDNEKKAQPPIVIITSNNEKDLPNAFLRRCIFHYLDFPNQEELTAIVNAHFPKIPDLTESLVKSFVELREGTDTNSSKQVSTSELIDWIKALLLSFTPQQIREKIKQGKIPFLGVLLKTREEQIRYHRQPHDTK